MTVSSKMFSTHRTASAATIPSPRRSPILAAVRASRKDQSKSLFGPGVLDVCAKADVVFLALHGTCGEDGRVQAAFDLLGIPYTGAGLLIERHCDG